MDKSNSSNLKSEEDKNPRSINEKEKGKIRSKRARDRKKQYFDELEVRVRYLEKENIRLENVIEKYKAQKYQEIDESSANVFETMKKIFDKSRLVFKQLKDLFFA